MILLALDAATLHLSLALGVGEPGALVVCAEADFPPEQKSSRVLPQAITQLLAAHGHTLADLSGIVVGTGPGSLTGLRIALATAKALAYARKLPLMGVSSLEAMAWEAGPGEGLTVPLLDARRGELYAGLFRRRGDTLETVEAALALTPALLIERLADQGPLRIFGPGEALVRSELQSRLTYDGSAPPLPRARALLARAPRILPPFDPPALFALEPRYVRAPEAEWIIKPRKPR